MAKSSLAHLDNGLHARDRGRMCRELSRAGQPGVLLPARAEGFRLVIDLGNGALGVLQRYAGLFSIDAICVSHLHADHCVDLAAYWVARQYAPDGSRPPIPVYGPRGTAGRVTPDLGPGAEIPDGPPLLRLP
jgi:ribonuclease BN (tRNA processing enzyme)